MTTLSSQKLKNANYRFWLQKGVKNSIRQDFLIRDPQLVGSFICYFCLKMTRTLTFFGGGEILRIHLVRSRFFVSISKIEKVFFSCIILFYKVPKQVFYWLFVCDKCIVDYNNFKILQDDMSYEATPLDPQFINEMSSDPQFINEMVNAPASVRFPI